MLKDYLGQTATLKSKTSVNAYNEPIFETKEIDCRIVNKFKQITNEKGELVVSSGVVECVDLIKVGDLVNDRIVMAANAITGLDEILGYKGYLR